MKVLFIAPGNSIHSYKWIDAISQFDTSDTIHWFSYEPFLKPPSNLIKSYTPRRSLSFPLFRITIYVLFLIRSLFQFKYNIVHIHSAGTYSIFAIICHLLGIRYILTPWGSDIIFNSKNFFKKPFLVSALANSTHITCDAQFVKDLVLDLSPSSAVTIINFGIDTHFFTNQNKATSNLLPSHSKHNFNRSHEPVYNIETLILAAKLLRNKGISFKLQIAGTGSLTSSLVELVRSFQLESFVHFSGRYNYSDLPTILSDNNIYISTSLSDAGISASIAEAMSCGLVCIASDSAENPLWITHGVNGFLFNTGSPESLFNVLLDCLEVREQWPSIVKSARQTIRDRNDINVEIRKAYQHTDLRV